MTRYKVCPNQLNIKKVVVVVGEGGGGGGGGRRGGGIASPQIKAHIF